MNMSELLNAIRTAIEDSDVTRYRISVDTGIAESQLSRLMSDDGGLSIESFELLADYLELEVIVRPKRKRKGK